MAIKKHHASNKDLEKYRERFWSKIHYLIGVPNHYGGCWEWWGSRMKNGYGVLAINRHNHLAHRLSYYYNNKTRPEQWLVLHRCNNRGCVNPNHLYLGTYKDNARDKFASGNGLTGENSARGKLKARETIEIRERYKVGGISYAQLARIYDVNKASIGQVIRGDTWKETLEQPPDGD